MNRARARVALNIHQPGTVPNRYGNPEYRCRCCRTAWPCRTRTAASAVTRREERGAWVVAVVTFMAITGILTMLALWS